MKGKNFVYVTVFHHSEVVFVEGTYNKVFIDAFLRPYGARWDPEQKRWEVQKRYLKELTAEVKAAYDTVYYGQGGDYETIKGE